MSFGGPGLDREWPAFDSCWPAAGVSSWRVPGKGVDFGRGYVSQHQWVILRSQRKPCAEGARRSKILQVQNFLDFVMANSYAIHAVDSPRAGKKVNVLRIPRPTLPTCVHVSLFDPFFGFEVEQQQSGVGRRRSRNVL